MRALPLAASASGILQAATNGFLGLAALEQGHAERVPTIEKLWIQRHAAPVESDGFLDLAKGQVTVGVVE
jgi:hypothetical protein